MKKILLLSIMLLFYACSPVRKTAVPPTSTVQSTPSLLPSTTASRTQGPTSTPTPTPSAERPLAFQTTKGIAIPTVVWADDIAMPVVIEDFAGIWSPTANELVGTQGKRSYATGTLAITQNPTFALTPLENIHKNTVMPEIAWSPDGQTILYQVAPGEFNTDGSGLVLLMDVFSDLWMMEKDTRTTQPTHFTEQKALNFWGWMDDRTVVLMTYHGGGHIGYTEWDYVTDNILASDVLSTYARGALTNIYAPVINCHDICTTYVLLRDAKEADEVCLEGCQSKAFPRNQQTFPPYVEIFFQDWLPGTDKMLVAVKGWDQQETERARLLLWDIRSDQLASVMAGGIYGKYSADGKMLAWASYGPADQFSSKLTGPVALDSIDSTAPIYLNLTDLTTNQIVLSLPVTAYTFEEYSIDNFVKPIFSLSPDNRWITLLTPGRVLIDDNNWPVGVRNNERYSWSFNVIDLKTRQLVKTIQIQGESFPRTYTPVWSPQSDQFIFQDITGNWQRFIVETASIIPLTKANGGQAGNPSWSFDGRYLQLTSERNDLNCKESTCFRRTYVFDFSSSD